jgi:hypothetical protein
MHIEKTMMEIFIKTLATVAWKVAQKGWKPPVKASTSFGEEELKEIDD